MVHRRQCPCIGFELVAVWSQESNAARVRAAYIARKSILSIPTPSADELRWPPLLQRGLFCLPFDTGRALKEIFNRR